MKILKRKYEDLVEVEFAKKRIGSQQLHYIYKFDHQFLNKRKHTKDGGLKVQLSVFLFA